MMLTTIGAKTGSVRLPTRIFVGACACEFVVSALLISVAAVPIVKARRESPVMTSPQETLWRVAFRSVYAAVRYSFVCK
jgi:hypothetical protein